MAYDHRIIDATGRRIPYSCENRSYRTHMTKGNPHGEIAPTGGSVFEAPLVNHAGHTLWLEHVEEISSGAELYWLMWYQPSGVPTIPMSGVFDRAELGQMIGQLASFIP